MTNPSDDKPVAGTEVYPRCVRCGESEVGWVSGQVLPHKRDCAVKLIATLRSEVEALRARVAEMAWIPCSERMPEEEQPVWIFEDGWVVTEAYCELGTWRAPEGWRHQRMNPTHWKPRYVEPKPKPPNEAP